MTLESYYGLPGEKDDFLYKVVCVVFTDSDSSKSHLTLSVLNFSKHGFT